MNLSDNIESVFRLTPAQNKALKKLNLTTLRGLLYHFPSRYDNLREVKKISELVPKDSVTIYGKIKKLKTRKAFRKKTPLGEAIVEDETGNIKVIWFNQPYLAKMFHDGNAVKLRGTVSSGKNGLYLANPEIEHWGGGALPESSDSLFEVGTDMPETPLLPIYPESRGITSRWFYHSIKKILAGGIDSIEETIPADVLDKYHLPRIRTALLWIHAPREEKENVAARKRFSFEQIFMIQLAEQKRRLEYGSRPAFVARDLGDEMGDFLSRFPFKPTAAQERALMEIVKDLGSGAPMMRLLEGDVGSGKTLVAAAAAYAIVSTRPKENAGGKFGNLQVAYMAPTEILAKQHFESFMRYFSHLPIQIGLITGSGCKKFPSKTSPDKATDISRAQLLKWVANGEIPILIGTHAIIQKSVSFKHLALSIIDEQHRFGTFQRSALAQKNTGTNSTVPHLLSMTATPIPRTLALTIYGDLDLTLIDEMPEGRKTVLTEIVSKEKRGGVYEKIRKELSAGRQAYVICPRIDEPDPDKELALLAKSVKAEAARLKKEIFPEHEIAILHSKMKDKEKEAVMKKFTEGETDILVATSMVEVGVNVENATSIIIEGAERFGLSQLHQLRGRVLRSSHQAYCYLFSETKNGKSGERLRAIRDAKSGFELAETDLKMRGAGELSGGKQWGLSDLAMEAIKNIKMVEAARESAKNIITKDPELKNHPGLKKIIEKSGKMHFE
ncbi:MAG: ATP-dependent DNA helicase RecG [Patescibacteria group bacterium]|mgnify:CR=1 FL=1